MSVDFVNIFIITLATIFLFLGLRIFWRQKRVGRSEKNKKNSKGSIMSSCRKKLPVHVVIKSDVLRNY